MPSVIDTVAPIFAPFQISMSVSSAPPEVPAGNEAPTVPPASARPRGYRISFKECDTTDDPHRRVASEGCSAPVSMPGPPLPKRRKGNILVAVLLFCLLGFFGKVLWQSFLRTQAYGVVTGRVITVSAPWNGVVEAWHFEEGDSVPHDDVVVSLSNQELDLKRESLLDDLDLTQAQLEAETVRIQLRLSELDREARKAQTELLAADAQLSSERAELDKLEAQLVRSRRLLDARNISQQKYEDLYYEYVGQKQKVARLAKSVEAARGRIEALRASSASQYEAQLKPLTARIQATRSELERIRTTLQQGQLSAPCDGTLARRHAFPGESIRVSEPVFEIIERGSQEIVLYIKQHRSRTFRPGQELELLVSPENRPIRAVIKRIGSTYIPPAAGLSRFYHSGEHTLPVYLAPVDPTELDRLRINQVVQLPYDWTEVFDETKATFDRLVGTLSGSTRQNTTKTDANASTRPTNSPSASAPLAEPQDRVNQTDAEFGPQRINLPPPHGNGEPKGSLPDAVGRVDRQSQPNSHAPIDVQENNP